MSAETIADIDLQLIAFPSASLLPNLLLAVVVFYLGTKYGKIVVQKRTVNKMSATPTSINFISLN